MTRPHRIARHHKWKQEEVWRIAPPSWRVFS